MGEHLKARAGSLTGQEETERAIAQLHAAVCDLVRWQKKLWQLFLREMGVTPTQYYALGRRHATADGLCIGNGEWVYAFHGVECDFHHISGTRSIQIEPLLEGHSPGTVGLNSLLVFLCSLAPVERAQYDALFKVGGDPIDGKAGRDLMTAGLLPVLEAARARSILIPLFPSTSPWYRPARIVDR